MNSEIFEFTFDYDEWPTSHKNKHECIRAYNGSIFNLRDSYKIVFPEKCYKIIDMYAHDHSDLMVKILQRFIKSNIKSICWQLLVNTKLKIQMTQIATSGSTMEILL